jgi:acetyl/propionyl-CoA carboxylase alpha subunit
MLRALSELSIGGIRTNRALFEEILADQAFRSGDLSTAFLDAFLERRSKRPEPELETEAVAALVAALQLPKPAPAAIRSRSSWATSGRSEQMR